MKRIAYQLGTLLFSLKLLFVDLIKTWFLDDDCVLKGNDQLRLDWIGLDCKGEGDKRHAMS